MHRTDAARIGKIQGTAALCASKLLEYPGPESEEVKAVFRKSDSGKMADVRRLHNDR